MKIAVLREADGETRVAAIPETVKKFTALGAQVTVESGAGEKAGIKDSDYKDAGASVAGRAAALKDAGIILCIAGPDPATLKGAAKGAMLVGALDPARRADDIAAYAKAGIEPLAMEKMPRITRAQSMDILSSQSNLAGYKAVIDAAAIYGRAFPMMMTAAGTVSAAKVFVMGVGVAGLQAIATARRLGAQVSATDVRSATKEQILSLGAKPIFVEGTAGIEGEGQGGYASETSPEYQKAQAELVSGHIAKQDIVITTALIPGRAAPRLISDAQLADVDPVHRRGNGAGGVELLHRRSHPPHHLITFGRALQRLLIENRPENDARMVSVAPHQPFQHREIIGARVEQPVLVHDQHAKAIGDIEKLAGRSIM